MIVGRQTFSCCCCYYYLICEGNANTFILVCQWVEIIQHRLTRRMPLIYRIVKETLLTLIGNLMNKWLIVCWFNYCIDNVNCFQFYLFCIKYKILSLNKKRERIDFPRATKLGIIKSHFHTFVKMIRYFKSHIFPLLTFTAILLCYVHMFIIE